MGILLTCTAFNRIKNIRDTNAIPACHVLHVLRSTHDAQFLYPLFLFRLWNYRKKKKNLIPSWNYVCYTILAPSLEPLIGSDSITRSFCCSFVFAARHFQHQRNVGVCVFLTSAPAIRVTSVRHEWHWHFVDAHFSWRDSILFLKIFENG